MPVNDPEEMASVWADAYNRRDLDALVALYEPDGAFAARTGLLHGRDAIRDRFARVFSQQTQIQHRTGKLVNQGEIALCYGEWTLLSRAADGTETTRTGSSVEVLRRQPDGTWLYIIDDPDTAAS
jgi:uncharacterized protein (TIGR02246 family)